jgi:hypothetical protein
MLPEPRLARQIIETLGQSGTPLSKGVSYYNAGNEALWVTPRHGAEEAGRLPYLSARQVLSFDLAQQLPAQLGLAPGAAALSEDKEGWQLWHWLGDVYGEALLSLWQGLLPVAESEQPGLCLRLADAPRQLPGITAAQVVRHLRDKYLTYETMLALGAYQHLLPRALRQQAAVAEFGVERIVAAVQRLQLVPAPETVTEELQSLLVAPNASSPDHC